MNQLQQYSQSILSCLMHDNRGTVMIGQHQIKGDICIHSLLGDFIDIEWSIKEGVMRLSSTKHNSFSYSINNNIETFNHVPLKHNCKCPLLDHNISKNLKRPMRPCSVVLIENKQTNTILATQRPLNISFGGKWVLPGGHLELGETIKEGGIRECKQEVGLNKQSIVEIKQDVMAWQSVYTLNSEVKASGLVIYFRIEANIFQVLPQEGEIEKWEWRKMEKNGQPWGGGWAEGHLTYLRFINQSKN